MKSIKRFILLIAIIAVTVSGLALTASAADEEITLDGYGILFDEGALYYTYDVPKSLVGSECTLKLYCYDGVDGEVTAESELVSEKTVDGVEYYVLHSPAILPQNLRLPLIAKAVILDSDGEALAESNAITASFFEKTIDIIDLGTDDQAALFTKLLDFGAAMQRTLKASGVYTDYDLTASGGYADEYCKVVYDTYVDGELYGSEYVYLTEGTWFDLVADKTVSGAVFCGFSDSDGNALREFGENTSPTYNKYTEQRAVRGTTTYVKAYKTEAGVMATFDTYTSVSQYNVSNKNCNTKYAEPAKTMLKTDKNGVASTTVIANSAYVSMTTRADEKYISFKKIINVLSATTYPEGYEGDVSGAYKVGDSINSTKVENTGIFLTQSGEVENAAYHVFEADLMLKSSTKTTTTQLWLLNGEGNYLFGLNFVINSNSSISLTVNGGDDNNKVINEEVSVRASDWFNLRMEYYPTSGDEMETMIYVNGQYVGTYTSPFSQSAINGENDYSYNGAYVYHLNGVKNVTLDIDNLLITSVAKD